MSVIDDLVGNNKRYAEAFPGPLPTVPAAHLAVVACMDSRINVFSALGLADGQAHVIRNAGGVVTDARPVQGEHHRQPSHQPEEQRLDDQQDSPDQQLGDAAGPPCLLITRSRNDCMPNVWPPCRYGAELGHHTRPRALS